MYTKSLPSIETISSLAQRAKPFPATVERILRIAQQWHFERSVINFLKSFPRDEQFASMDDFVFRSEELELLIREERQTQREILRSP